MEVVLDSSFILSCIKRRIDFIEELEKEGFRIHVPLSVFQELKDLKKSDKIGREGRANADIAMKMLENKKIKKIRIGGRTVDEGLIRKGKEGVFIATLDREVKRNVPNRVVISNSKNSIILERD